MVLHVEDGVSRFDEAIVNLARKGSVKVLRSFLPNDNSNLVDSLGRTLLHYAAETNNISVTKYFLDNGYSVDCLDNEINSPLMLAVRNYAVDTAKLLIKAGANVYRQYSNGKSIISVDAIITGYSCYDDLYDRYPEMIKCILEAVRKDYWNDQQMLISKLTELGFSLKQAVYLEDANVTRLMLENGFSPNEFDVKNGNSPLHEAVKQSYYENVKILLEYGADVFAIDYNKLTPIYAFDYDSCDNTDQQVKILKILIEHGALSSQIDGYLTPSQSILRNRKLWAIKTLLQYDFDWQPYYSLRDLVINSNDDALEAIRGKNFNLNSTYGNTDEPTLLSYAVEMGRLAKVQFLLENGADPNIVDKDGYAPLTFTFRKSSDLQKGCLPIVRLMLKYGADAQHSTEDEQTVFDVAIENKREMLLEPVIAHLAMIEGHGQIVTDLIHRKINSQETFKNQFERCKKQLQNMKNTLIHGNITLYKLLIEDQTKIGRYARNCEFAAKFKKIMKMKQRSLDSYYSILLRQRVGKAINFAKLREEAVIALSQIIEYRIRNYNEILSKIVDDLSFDDLKNICKTSDFLEPDSFHLDILFGE